MMRTLIVPDVHENIEQVIRVLAVESFDKAVFLGDWVDRFKTQPGNLDDTIRWLYKNVDNEDFTFLYGNHDLPYAFSVYDLGCSGHQSDPLIGTFFKSDIAKKNFRLFADVDGWVLSHAGFTDKNIHTRNSVAQDAITHLEKGYMHHLVEAGMSRGGRQPVGGCTWLDFRDEFEPVEGFRQIVGHSRGEMPRRNGMNFCIDTGLKHYAIIEDGKLSIWNADGSRFENFDHIINREDEWND